MNQMIENYILMADAYKMTHWLQYPEGTEYIYSYFESRDPSQATMFFGLQYYAMAYLENFVVTQEMIEEADEELFGVFGNRDYFHREGWEHILNEHGGKLPVEIKAVQEGTWVNGSNVLMTLVNTDPKVPFITNFIETLLMKIWYPTTTATYSGRIHKLIGDWGSKTGTPEVSPFALNDFGYRGGSSEETCRIGGAAHLVSFGGTDNLGAIRLARHYYNAPLGVGMSVLASEHSTTTSYFEENECQAFENFIDATVPGGITSIVIDSYDAFRAVDQYIGQDLRQKIIDSGKRIVVRPDSGDPVEQVMINLNSLERNFGAETNEEGFKILPPYIGVIYGDFMSFETINGICEAMYNAGWAIDGRNIVFGMGGNLLQNHNRDDHAFAIKCSARMQDGRWMDVYKDPKTMSMKKSKRGRLALVPNPVDGVLETVTLTDETRNNKLRTVFLDGELTQFYTFDEVRAQSLSTRGNSLIGQELVQV